jgi:hypothetical protein
MRVRLALPAIGRRLASGPFSSQTLTGTDPTGLDAKCKDSSDIKFAGGNAFSAVGTWILP